MWMIRGPKTCDYCKEFNGQVIGQGGYFATTGDTILPDKKSLRSMNIYGPKGHPPLHAACDCYMVSSRKEPTVGKSPGEGPKVGKFVPAKTIKEAEEYAQKNLVRRKVDYSGIELPIANKINEQLSKHLGKYEGFPDNLAYIRKMPKGEKGYMRANQMLFEVGSMDTVKVAERIWENNIKTLESKKFFGYWSVKGHVPKNKAIKITIDHEIGHVWHENLIKSAYDYKDKAAKSILKEFNDTFRSISAWDMAKAVSEYANHYSKGRALEGHKEGFAECFALYKNNKKQLLPKMRSFFDKNLKRIK